ncbi:NUDIX domain-containing protein [Streptomyces corynorhini]|uniref:NUDIX domain-containing protein n=1 Tax=Streptomyces corynorhini TaxID=2282652 RepID=A0A370B3A6_9ACTN|nr:NUDIX domain-containing protein [Streptomyces corynorhini]RDG36337.1 NUDIX domain-containing protein [Streptomyces corynorhini]
MPMTPEHTRETIAAYAAAYPDERAALSTVLEALDRGDDVASRNTVPVHVTAGAVLLNERGEVLFVHHKALDRYLMPGGHLEHEDVNLMGAALRELGEVM